MELLAERQDAQIAALQRAIAELTDKQREAIRLYFYDELSQAEIATHLGVSQQVVSKRLFGVVRNGRRVGGAIARLRRLMADS